MVQVRYYLCPAEGADVEDVAVLYHFLIISGVYAVFAQVSPMNFVCHYELHVDTTIVFARFRLPSAQALCIVQGSERGKIARSMNCTGVTPTSENCSPFICNHFCSLAPSAESPAWSVGYPAHAVLAWQCGHSLV